ncbi:MAG: Uma2 family endonuclease [Planctomycetota bacterium]|nr:Uma2 family endonuclease [Planctomycetota bacterium]
MTVYMTRKDYEQLPEGTPVELCDGLLVKQPSPRWGHQRITMLIFRALTEVVEPVRVATGPVDVLIDEINVFVPDIVVLDDVPDDEAQYVGVPRVVFEVLSPSTKAHDRYYKTRRYLGLGVEEVWLIDRHERTIEIGTLREGIRAHRGDRVARSDVIGGFALVPDELFG